MKKLINATEILPTKIRSKEPAIIGLVALIASLIELLDWRYIWIRNICR